MGLSQKMSDLDIALETSVQHRISVKDGSKFNISKIGHHFIFEKTAEKLVSRNIGALKSSIMAIKFNFHVTIF